MLVLTSLAACTGDPPPRHAPAARAEAPRKPQPSAPTPAAPAGPERATPPTLRVTPVHTVAGWGLSVAAEGAQPVELSATVEVTTAGGRRGTLALRSACEAPSQPCVRLAPGGELLAPPWLDDGRLQGPCEALFDPGATGPVTFVVRSCDGQHQVRAQGVVP